MALKSKDPSVAADSLEALADLNKAALGKEYPKIIGEIATGRGFAETEKDSALAILNGADKRIQEILKSKPAPTPKTEKDRYLATLNDPNADQDSLSAAINYCGENKVKEAIPRLFEVMGSSPDQKVYVPAKDAIIAMGKDTLEAAGYDFSSFAKAFLEAGWKPAYALKFTLSVNLRSASYATGLNDAGLNLKQIASAFHDNDFSVKETADELVVSNLVLISSQLYRLLMDAGYKKEDVAEAVQKAFQDQKGLKEIILQSGGAKAGTSTNYSTHDFSHVPAAKPQEASLSDATADAISKWIFGKNFSEIEEDDNNAKVVLEGAKFAFEYMKKNGLANADGTLGKNSMQLYQELSAIFAILGRSNGRLLSDAAFAGLAGATPEEKAGNALGKISNAEDFLSPKIWINGTKEEMSVKGKTRWGKLLSGIRGGFKAGPSAEELERQERERKAREAQAKAEQKLNADLSRYENLGLIQKDAEGKYSLTQKASEIFSRDAYLTGTVQKLNELLSGKSLDQALEGDTLTSRQYLEQQAGQIELAEKPAQDQAIYGNFKVPFGDKEIGLPAGSITSEQLARLKGDATLFENIKLEFDSQVVSGGDFDVSSLPEDQISAKLLEAFQKTYSELAEGMAERTTADALVEAMAEIKGREQVAQGFDAVKDRLAAYLKEKGETVEAIDARRAQIIAELDKPSDDLTELKAVLGIVEEVPQTQEFINKAVLDIRAKLENNELDAQTRGKLEAHLTSGGETEAAIAAKRTEIINALTAANYHENLEILKRDILKIIQAPGEEERLLATIKSATYDSGFLHIIHSEGAGTLAASDRSSEVNAILSGNPEKREYVLNSLVGVATESWTLDEFQVKFGGFVDKKILEFAAQYDLEHPPGQMTTDDFFRAVRSGDLQAVLNGIAQGIDVNVTGVDGWTPLTLSIQDEQYEIADALLNLQNAPDVNAKTENGLTAVYFAAYNENEDMVKLLIKKGAVSSPEDLKHYASNLKAMEASNQAADKLEFAKNVLVMASPTSTKDALATALVEAGYPEAEVRERLGLGARTGFDAINSPETMRDWLVSKGVDLSGGYEEALIDYLGQNQGSLDGLKKTISTQAGYLQTTPDSLSNGNVEAAYNAWSATRIFVEEGRELPVSLEISNLPEPLKSMDYIEIEPQFQVLKKFYDSALASQRKSLLEGIQSYFEANTGLSKEDKEKVIDNFIVREWVRGIPTSNPSMVRNLAFSLDVNLPQDANVGNIVSGLKSFDFASDDPAKYMPDMAPHDYTVANQTRDYLDGFVR